jgi:rare lipoprotein A
MSSGRIVNLLSILLVITLACASCTKKTHEVPKQVGVASWYGHPFDGRLTANGEVYNMEKMTAAHRTLPFGTVVRVQSLVNQRTTEVTVNDRGPYVKDRIIDLSHAAAQAISMPGTATVRLEVISTPPTRGADVFAVQIGAFAQRPEAEQVRAEMQKKYGVATLVFRDGDQTWRVLVGFEPTIEGAKALAAQLSKTGDAFVVRVDTEQ